MTGESMVRRSAVPLTAAVDGEVVMFHPDRGAYFSLGGVGSRIWELVAESTPIADLCGALSAEYTVEPETCRAEVVAFVEQLHGAGLVELTG